MNSVPFPFEDGLQTIPDDLDGDVADTEIVQFFQCVLSARHPRNFLFKKSQFLKENVSNVVIVQLHLTEPTRSIRPIFE